MRLVEHIQNIHKLKANIAKLRQLNSGELAALKKWYDVTYTYNSNAIEGRSVQEILEAKNHKDAIDLLYTAVQYKTSLNAELMQAFHQAMMKDIGACTLPDMSNIWAAYHEDTDKGDLVAIARFYYDCAQLEPDIYGGGQVLRLITNAMLLRCGYPLQILPFERKQEYLSSLHSSKTFSDFYTFFLSVQYESMKDYLRMLAT